MKNNLKIILPASLIMLTSLTTIDAKAETFTGDPIVTIEAPVPPTNENPLIPDNVNKDNGLSEEKLKSIFPSADIIKDPVTGEYSLIFENNSEEIIKNEFGDLLSVTTITYLKDPNTDILVSSSSIRDLNPEEILSNGNAIYIIPVENSKESNDNIFLNFETLSSTGEKLKSRLSLNTIIVDLYDLSFTSAPTLTTDEFIKNKLSIQNNNIENVTTENVSTENVTAENIITEDVTTEDVSTEDVSTEDVSTEDVSTENVSTEDVSTEDVLTEDVLTEEPLTKEPTTEESTTKESTTKESTTKESTTKESTTAELSNEVSTVENFSKEKSTYEKLSPENKSPENYKIKKPSSESTLDNSSLENSIENQIKKDKNIEKNVEIVTLELVNDDLTNTLPETGVLIKNGSVPILTFIASTLAGYLIGRRKK